MRNLISNAIARVTSLLNVLQVKSLLAVALVGFLMLTTNVDSGRNNKALSDRLDAKTHQIDSVRPKTTNEWKEEARETEDSPGERLKNIGEESAQAFKEFGAMYPKTAKSSARALEDNPNIGRDSSNSNSNRGQR